MPAFPAIRTLADVEAIERTPLAERLDAESTYEVLRRAAREHGDRPALRFLAKGTPDEEALVVTYAELLRRVAAVPGIPVRNVPASELNTPCVSCMAAARPGPLMHSIANRGRCSSPSAIRARTTTVRCGPAPISSPVRSSHWTRAPAN